VRPWYETAFRSDYLDRYPHRDDEEARSEVAAIVELIDPPRDQALLDLGCGAGRHLIALHQAGFRNLVGLDLSYDLLEVARRRAQEASASIEFVSADMREIPFAGRFATILSMFTSFGYFPTDDDNEKVLSAAFRALRSRGRFLIDTLAKARTISDLVPSERRVVEAATVCISRAISPDGRRVEKETIVRENGTETRHRESVRLYAPDELSGMLRAVGFVDVAAYGSLRGDEPTPSSRRLVVVGRKDSP